MLVEKLKEQDNQIRFMKENLETQLRNWESEKFHSPPSRSATIGHHRRAPQKSMRNHFAMTKAQFSARLSRNSIVDSSRMLQFDGDEWTKDGAKKCQQRLSLHSATPSETRERISIFAATSEGHEFTVPTDNGLGKMQVQLPTSNLIGYDFCYSARQMFSTRGLLRPKGLMWSRP